MDSKFKNTIEYLKKAFPSILSYTSQGECVIITTPKTLPKLVAFLKNHTATKFEQLIDISAVDHPQRKYRFEVVYQFLSIRYNQRLSVAVFVSEAMSIESISSIYPSAG
jgi:NADH:ubiquinone oxidoreductase subunit C